MYGQTPLIFSGTKFHADPLSGCLDVRVQTDGRKRRLQQTLHNEANTPKKSKNTSESNSHTTSWKEVKTHISYQTRNKTMFVSTILTKHWYEVWRYWGVALNAKDVFLKTSHNSGLFSNTNTPIMRGCALGAHKSANTVLCISSKHTF